MKKNPYIYDPKVDAPIKFHQPNKFYQPNPIKPMATRASTRNEKLACAVSMAGGVLTAACLAIGFYALVVFIFGVTP